MQTGYSINSAMTSGYTEQVSVLSTLLHQNKFQMDRDFDTKKWNYRGTKKTTGDNTFIISQWKGFLEYYTKDRSHKRLTIKMF